MLNRRPAWVTDEDVADTRAVFSVHVGRMLTVGEAEDILTGLDELAEELATDEHG